MITGGKWEGHLEGFAEVMANLRTEINRMNERGLQGLIDVAIFIRREMDTVPPLIPIDTGNLRQSWFVLAHNTHLGPGLVMGFSANYAIFVHEMMDTATFGAGSVGHVNWSRPGSGPKFFEDALRRNKDVILKIIAKNVTIK